jgi:hypothetical protein
MDLACDPRPIIATASPSNTCALVRFSPIAAGNSFRLPNFTPESSTPSAPAPIATPLPPCGTILQKLRAKGLVEKLPHARRYRLLPNGYSICLVFLKLFERVYAPLTAGLLSPIKAGAKLYSQHRSQLDRLYQRVVDDLDKLMRAVGLKAANQILLTDATTVYNQAELMCQRARIACRSVARR